LIVKKLEQKLKEIGIYDLYSDIEIPLIKVLSEMEMSGIKVDAARLKNLSLELDSKIKVICEKIYRMVGERFNLDSPKQLSTVLFEKLKLPQKKKTKTYYSTDMDVLEELSQSYDIAKYIIDYRMLSKLKNTYTDSLLEMINPITKRVHTTFNQTIAATGRLSSSEPNLQNIPVKGEEGRKVRELFIADEGFFLLSADYSQIELRILAHLSGDEIMMEAFSQNEDIHNLTAQELFRVEKKDVTSEMRRIAKTVNFGIIYGLSPFGLAKELRISDEEAEAFIESYFVKYSGVKRYIDKILNNARNDGYVRTISRRIRFIPDINSNNKVARGFAERVAINTPIQGTSADIIKIAMIKIFYNLKKANFKSRLVLQVHDELILEVAEDEMEMVENIVRDEMENVMKLNVPLKVDIGIGKNWLEAKENLRVHQKKITDTGIS